MYQLIWKRVSLDLKTVARIFPAMKDMCFTWKAASLQKVSLLCDIMPYSYLDLDDLCPRIFHNNHDSHSAEFTNVQRNAQDVSNH
jgi:hypothetical protein